MKIRVVNQDSIEDRRQSGFGTWASIALALDRVEPTPGKEMQMIHGLKQLRWVALLACLCAGVGCFGTRSSVEGKPISGSETGVTLDPNPLIAVA